MFDELWSEIQDAPGEIFDVIEYKEEWEQDDKFDVESYIKGNTDYWCKLWTILKCWLLVNNLCGTLMELLKSLPATITSAKMTWKI